jgi:hypothetical protein
MGSLLTGVNRRETPISPLHTSFHDFLMEEGRSGSWHVDITAGHSLMALGCVRVMNAGLRFNICMLGTSFLRNCDVPSLPSLI